MFKNRVCPVSEEDLYKNLQFHTEENLTASNRKVLAIKCIEVAWAGIKERKEIIILAFVKCGLSNKLDSSKDHMVKI